MPRACAGCISSPARTRCERRKDGARAPRLSRRRSLSSMNISAACGAVSLLRWPRGGGERRESPADHRPLPSGDRYRRLAHRLRRGAPDQARPARTRGRGVRRRPFQWRGGRSAAGRGRRGGGRSPAVSGANRPMPAAPSPSQQLQWGPVALGGLLAGALDLTFAFIFYGYRYPGTGPALILRTIASGVLGPEAFTLGAWTTALGAALHFLLAQ